MFASSVDALMSPCCVNKQCLPSFSVPLFHAPSVLFSPPLQRPRISSCFCRSACVIRLQTPFGVAFQQSSVSMLNTGGQAASTGQGYHQMQCLPPAYTPLYFTLQLPRMGLQTSMTSSPLALHVCSSCLLWIIPAWCREVSLELCPSPWRC